MDIFALRDQLVEDCASCTRSFINIADLHIRRKVDAAFVAGAFWPEPLLQLNPAFEAGGTIEDLVSEGVLHDELRRGRPRTYDDERVAQVIALQETPKNATHRPWPVMSACRRAPSIAGLSCSALTCARR